MSEKLYVGGWWMWVLGLIVVTVMVFGGLRILGVIGERVVFENSYQYHESRKSEVAVFEAQLAEIESQLQSTSLDESTKDQLRTKQAAIRVQLNVARSKQ